MVLHNISLRHWRFKCVAVSPCQTLHGDLQLAKSSLLTSFCKSSTLPRFGSLSAVQPENQEWAFTKGENTKKRVQSRLSRAEQVWTTVSEHPQPQIQTFKHLTFKPYMSWGNHCHTRQLWANPIPSCLHSHSFPAFPSGFVHSAWHLDKYNQH